MMLSQKGRAVHFNLTRKNWMELSSAVLGNESCLDMIGWTNVCGGKKNKKKTTTTVQPVSLMASWQRPTSLLSIVCLAGSLYLGGLAVGSQMEELISSFKNNCFKLYVCVSRHFECSGSKSRWKRTSPTIEVTTDQHSETLLLTTKHFFNCYRPRKHVKQCSDTE